jgi:hypothetical protein
VQDPISVGRTRVLSSERLFGKQFVRRGRLGSQ